MGVVVGVGAWSSSPSSSSAWSSLLPFAEAVKAYGGITRGAHRGPRGRGRPAGRGRPTDFASMPEDAHSSPASPTRPQTTQSTMRGLRVRPKKNDNRNAWSKC